MILCSSCADALPCIDLKTACPRCGAPYGIDLCTECPMPGSEEALSRPDPMFPFAQARCALSFEGVASKVIRAYKDEDELRLDAVIASFVCAAMRGRTLGRNLEFERKTRDGRPCDDWTQWGTALAHVPASPEALVRRDFDHMERVAEICSRRTGLPLLRGLVARKGARDQRRLGKDARIANRKGSFVFNGDRRSMPRFVVLIDDVLTTGSTLSDATQVLLDAGAHEVRIVTCCRVW